jgi:hypothetical protein
MSFDCRALAIAALIRPSKHVRDLVRLTLLKGSVESKNNFARLANPPARADFDRPHRRQPLTETGLGRGTGT